MGKAEQWAWKQKTPSPVTKLLLVALADNADEDGVCWPGVKHLMIKTGLSERTVRRSLRLLEAERLMITESRMDQHGRPRSNSYVLAMRPAWHLGWGQSGPTLESLRKNLQKERGKGIHLLL